MFRDGCIWPIVVVVTGLLGAIFIIGLAAGFHIKSKPTADQRYGCTFAQQAPNGECR